MSLINAKTYPVPRPTPSTLFLRSFLPWQFYRFLIINFKMTLMIIKSHGGKTEVDSKLNDKNS